MASGSSDLGDRQHQEDAWLVTARDQAILCAVCDGMGGGSSGHPAAALAISMLRAAFESGAPPHQVIDAVAAANLAIVARAQAAKRREPGSDPFWNGMGTTAEVALFTPGRAHLAHVGDGFIYRFRNGRLTPLTTAHTLINDYRRVRPETTEAELEKVPHNVIVRALGMRPDLEIDRSEVETLPGDIWLLCSDGLTVLVSEETIAAILERGGTAEALDHALLDAARETPAKPGAFKDNITAVVHVVER